MKQLQATVYGRVQGVFFRQSTHQEARRLGLSGWVKNEWDGTVTVVAVGTEALLIQLETYLNQGPVGAQVSQVESRWSDADQIYDGFEVRW